MTPLTKEQLEAIRERDRVFWDGCSPFGGTGTRSQIDRRDLLAEVDRLTALNERLREAVHQKERLELEALAELDERGAENERLRAALTNLLDRVDRTGGLGEYKGGPISVLHTAREALQQKP